MTERAERIVRNEILFREVNEQVDALHAAISPTGTFPIVCECGSGTCSEAIMIEATDYQAVRAHPERFVVVSGHQIKDVEDVLEEHGTFAVVAKKPGAPRRLAVTTDPRRS